MEWLIQNNLRSADMVDSQFEENLIRLGVKHTKVNIFPFVEKIFPETTTSAEIETAEELIYDNRTDIVINGSVTFSRLAQNRNISPGCFLTDNSDFPVILANYGADNLLNGDARWGALEDMDVEDENTYYFVRPVKDNKAFSGMEVNGIQFRNWKEQMLKIPIAESPLMNSETPIIIASVKKIYKEYRFFICNKRMVTYSLYKLGDTVLPRVDENRAAEWFVFGMMESWTPHVAYVMDIAETPDGFKIVELNAFGSAGFYKCDTQKIIMAVEDLKYGYR